MANQDVRLFSGLDTDTVATLGGVSATIPKRGTLNITASDAELTALGATAGIFITKSTTTLGQRLAAKFPLTHSD